MEHFIEQVEQNGNHILYPLLARKGKETFDPEDIFTSQEQ